MAKKHKLEPDQGVHQVGEQVTIDLSDIPLQGGTKALLANFVDPGQGTPHWGSLATNDTVANIKTKLANPITLDEVGTHTFMLVGFEAGSLQLFKHISSQAIKP